MPIDALHLLDKARLVKNAAVSHDGHGLRHLQRRDLHVALADGKVREIAIEHLAAELLLHEFVVGNAALGFRGERDAGARAKTQLERPIAHLAAAGLDADLVKPRVARLRERIGEVQRTRSRFASSCGRSCARSPSRAGN